MRTRALVALGVLLSLAGLAIAEPDLVTQGHVLLGNGEPEKALALFQKAVDENPKNLDALLGIGDCYLDLDRPDDVIAAAGKAIDVDENRAACWLLLAEGNILKAQHLTEAQKSGSEIRLSYLEAARRAEQALELDPKIAGAHLILAQAHLGDYEYDEALAELEKEIASDPRNVQANWLLGNILFKQKKDYVRAIKAFKTVVARDATHILAWKWLGAAYEYNRAKVEAANAYLEAAKLDPTDSYARQRLYESSLDGSSPNWEFTRVFANFEKLIDALGGEKGALAAPAVRMLVWGLNAAGKSKEALAKIDALIKVAPKDANNHRRRYDVLITLRKNEEAIASLKKAIQLNPTNEYNYNQLHRIALTSVQRRKLDEGVAMLEWLFKTRESADVANDLGLTHRDGTRDYRKSLKWYVKASELAPENIDILNDTGLIYQYHMKNDAKAMKYYEKVLEIGRDVYAGELEVGKPPRGYGDALENMAMIYIDRRMFSKAKEVLDELLGFYPTRPKALMLKRKLKN